TNGDPLLPHGLMHVPPTATNMYVPSRDSLTLCTWNLSLPPSVLIVPVQFGEHVNPVPPANPGSAVIAPVAVLTTIHPLPTTYRDIVVRVLPTSIRERCSECHVTRGYRIG